MPARASDSVLCVDIPFLPFPTSFSSFLPSTHPLRLLSLSSVFFFLRNSYLSFSASSRRPVCAWVPLRWRNDFDSPIGVSFFSLCLLSPLHVLFASPRNVLINFTPEIEFSSYTLLCELARTRNINCRWFLHFLSYHSLKSSDHRVHVLFAFLLLFFFSRCVIYVLVWGVLVKTGVRSARCAMFVVMCISLLKQHTTYILLLLLFLFYFHLRSRWMMMKRSQRELVWCCCVKRLSAAQLRSIYNHSSWASMKA